MPNNEPIDNLFELSKVLGLQNRHGRIISVNKDGSVECNGLKYENVQEFDRYHATLLQDLSVGINKPKKP